MEARDWDYSDPEPGGYAAAIAAERQFEEDQAREAEEARYRPTPRPVGECAGELLGALVECRSRSQYLRDYLARGDTLGAKLEHQQLHDSVNAALDAFHELTLAANLQPEGDDVQE